MRPLAVDREILSRQAFHAGKQLSDTKTINGLMKITKIPSTKTQISNKFQ